MNSNGSDGGRRITTKEILRAESERLNARCFLLWSTGFKYKGQIWRFLLYEPHPGDRIVDFLYYFETRLAIYNDKGRVHIISVHQSWEKKLGKKWMNRKTGKELLQIMMKRRASES